MQFQNFDKFVCVGDTRSVDYGPFTIRATLVADTDSRPDDFDCYDADAIAAWRNDDWGYVGVVLSVWLDDACLDDACAGLWGVEVNCPDSDNTYLATCANEMLPEAIAAADAWRTRVKAMLAD